MLLQVEVGQDGEVELPWEDRFDPDYIDFTRADLGARPQESGRVSADGTVDLSKNDVSVRE